MDSTSKQSFNDPSTADGTYPVGEALLNLRADPNIVLYLSPVAKPISVASVQLDLRNLEHRNLVAEWMQSPLFCWLHVAPVCGTASRAREIQRHWSDPKPLRSNDFPHGLPDLSEKDMTRVDIANDLVAYSCKLFQDAAACNIFVTMENPSNSYFWLTDWFTRLRQSVALTITDFQACMYGGKRPNGRDLLGTLTNSLRSTPGVTIRINMILGDLPKLMTAPVFGQQVWSQSIQNSCALP